MLDLLWLVPALPLAGFVVLFATAGRLPQRAIAIVGAGSVGLAALIALAIGYAFIASPPPGHAYTQTLWTWMTVGGLQPGIAFYLDALSMTMMLVITCVGFLIHLYSTEYMDGEEGYSRYFAYMNLFVAFMLTLVLGDNLLLLFLGWEGVGLCSYLLIGYWYTDPANGDAARKAFIVTRVGDVAMTVGLLLLFTQLGTLNVQALMAQASAQWAVGSGLAVAAALLLLGGAVGKSAQLPLQTWLPDAMAGPTPVSALIHAATMVTAGVYLIARMHELYLLAPSAQVLVGVVGALTLLIAAFSALAQTDIKRILAYSTISQIGYMFLALGAGAWSAAIFHFLTHAFFKALLFLAAGAVINAVHHEQNIFKMGGLHERLPLVSWTFLIGSGALAAFPLITSGFYSKDLILWQVLNSDTGGFWLWAAGLLGAFLTAVYTFRMVFVAFFGEAKTEVSHPPGLRIQIPLVALAVLALVGGFVEIPHTLGGFTPLSHFLETALPAYEGHGPLVLEALLQLLAAGVALAGIYLAYLMFLRQDPVRERILGVRHAETVRAFWLGGCGFDRAYNTVLVRPFLWLARSNRNDVVDSFYDAVASTTAFTHRLLSLTQNGVVRRYGAGIATGAVVAVALAVLA